MKNTRLTAISVLTAFISAAAAGCSGPAVKNDAPKVRVCINKFESEGIDAKIITSATAGMHKKLQEFKGPESAVSREIDGISKSANRQLIGRISRLGEKYVVTVKVVEGEKGRLVFNETAIIKESDLDETIEDIAEKISDRDEVWE